MLLINRIKPSIGGYNNVMQKAMYVLNKLKIRRIGINQGQCLRLISGQTKTEFI